MANLKLQMPQRDPVMDLRKFNIMSMLRYMCNDVENTQTVLNTIFAGVSNIECCINYHKVFIINERPIVYVTSLTLNNSEIPINMGFYKSLGISRGDSTIKEYWFPTTQIIRLLNNYKLSKPEDNYKLSKPEDNYILKYDAIYKLSTNEADIKEQDDLLKYGRFINKHYALICYLLYQNNSTILDSDFIPAQLQPNDISIHYTTFIKGCATSSKATINNNCKAY